MSATPAAPRVLRVALNWTCQSPLQAFAVIFLLSFSVRCAILLMGIIPPDLFLPSGEIGRVATTLARTGQFANPYLIPTGPTAHPAPFYTGVLGLIYYLFGVTRTAANVRALVSITGYSTLYATLPWVGSKLGLGTRAGLISGIAGALILHQGLQEVTGAWNEPFPAITLGLLLVAFLRRWSAGQVSANASPGLLLRQLPAPIQDTFALAATPAGRRRGSTLDQSKRSEPSVE